MFEVKTLWAGVYGLMLRSVQTLEFGELTLAHPATMSISDIVQGNTSDKVGEL